MASNVEHWAQLMRARARAKLAHRSFLGVGRMAAAAGHRPSVKPADGLRRRYAHVGHRHARKAKRCPGHGAPASSAAAAVSAALRNVAAGARRSERPMTHQSSSGRRPAGGGSEEAEIFGRGSAKPERAPAAYALDGVKSRIELLAALPLAMSGRFSGNRRGACS